MLRVVLLTIVAPMKCLLAKCLVVKYLSAKCLLDKLMASKWFSTKRRGAYMTYDVGLFFSRFFSNILTVVD
jgi:hypothetical protein